MCVTEPRCVRAFDVTVHGTVNFDPYISRSVVVSMGGTPTALREFDDGVVEQQRAVWVAAASVSPGTPLSSFASTVQGALGPSQGALAMISMASPGGELNLVASTQSPTPARPGTGVGR